MSIVKVNQKNTKKVSTIDAVAMASIKGAKKSDAIAILKRALAASENITKERARACYILKSRVKDFKAFINEENDGILYGIKYNQANNLSNMYAYVWCTKELQDYDSNKATALVAYVRKDYSKVISLHNKGIISPSMSKSDITDALKKHFGGKCETVKKASKENKTAESGLADAINTIERLVITYNNLLVKKGKNADAKKITDAWDVIIKSL